MSVASWKPRGSREGVADERRPLLVHMAPLCSLPEVHRVVSPGDLGGESQMGLLVTCDWGCSPISPQHMDLYTLSVPSCRIMQPTALPNTTYHGSGSVISCQAGLTQCSGQVAFTWPDIHCGWLGRGKDWKETPRRVQIQEAFVIYCWQKLD